ncbi:hypothetical protein ANN_26643 [Periplaneta americana]|uniref:Reverse transcriptase domain-containing protein n=1 Tax=Periplaneta americana TaxID=6978 RepID=A0ABQ8RYX2_PERAM|nr:hypothetical protein ANN_26643 [Periplaneta americana]
MLSCSTDCNGRNMAQLTLVLLPQGLKQGAGLAPLLFNLALESAIRKLRVDTRGTLLYKTAQLVGYADDINLMGRTTRTVKEIFEDLNREGKEIGLKISEQKTKVMVQARRRKLVPEGSKVEIVKEFKYLGIHLTNKNEEMAEIQTANKAYFSVLPIFRNRDINQRLKLRRLPADPELRSGTDSIPAWADYLVGFFSEVFPNRKTNVRHAHGKLNCVDAASVPLHTKARMSLSTCGKCFPVTQSNGRNKAQLTHDTAPTANLNAIDLIRDRTRNLGHRRQRYTNYANQADKETIITN